MGMRAELPNIFCKYNLSVKMVAFLVLGIVLLVIRNSDPLTSLIVYTEDGSWVGIALTKGWYHALINAKEGYFVWGNLLFLAASVASSNVFCGSELSCLPQSIAFWSYLFFSFVGTLAWFVTRGLIPGFGRLILFFLILFIPLGGSSNEIIGRISNIGYYFVFITMLLMFCKFRGVGNRYAIDLFLLICASTNPVSLVLIPVLAAFTLLPLSGLSIQGFKNWLRSYAPLLGGVILLAIFILARMLDSKGSSVTGEFQWDSFIEVVFARSLLYPFVFPFYNLLTDSVAIFYLFFW